MGTLENLEWWKKDRAEQQTKARKAAEAGWVKMVGANGNGAFREEIPGRWSRLWYDDPPMGTEVFLGGASSRFMSAAGSGRPLLRETPCARRPRG